MMEWAAIVPWKQGPDSKSRLSAKLDPVERQALAFAMAQTVITCLSSVRQIKSVHLLAPASVAEWPCRWLRDKGRGLNDELAAARDDLGCPPIVVVLADLPCLTDDDVERLLAAALGSGAAFAPDRRGQGSNAIALADRQLFQFGFGPHSLAHHRRQRPDAAIIERAGLAFDVDTLDDLDQLKSNAGRVISVSGRGLWL